MKFELNNDGSLKSSSEVTLDEDGEVKDGLVLLSIKTKNNGELRKVKKVGLNENGGIERTKCD